MGEITAAILCLAMNIYHEARGEPEPGQWMVAAVTINRVASDRYPDTVCSVVSQHRQFSWTQSHPRFPDDEEAWEKSVMIAQLTLHSQDDLYNWNGALHYTANKPHWTKSMNQFSVIGNHYVWSE